MRLALFQVAVGMCLVLLMGTLNRVMIVELGSAPGWWRLMAALPVLIAPFRALLGFRSDTHRSFIGWKRTPYLWYGSVLQFGGLAIMPFALILLSGDTRRSRLGRAMPARRSRSCWSAPGCTRPRPQGLRSPPTLRRRRRGRGSWRCSM